MAEAKKKPENLEALYPLSPVQMGMLYHSMSDPESGVYVVQISFDVAGDFRPDLFREAWAQIFDRHPIFRTVFLSMDAAKPLQAVLKTVKLPWRDEDWRGVAAEEQERRFDRLLAEDRIEGFPPGKTLPSRFWMIRLSDDRYRFLWSKHHAIVDGWSMSIVFAELFDCYNGLRTGSEPALAPAVPFRRYIQWLSRQDETEAIAYWKTYLAGYERPGRAIAERGGGGQEHREAAHLSLSVQETERLKTFMKKHELTPNIITQAAWAFVSSRYRGCNDLVFGATVSGRPPQVAGVESIVGPFINTVPVLDGVSHTGQSVNGHSDRDQVIG